MVADDNKENVPLNLQKLRENFIEIKKICSRASVLNNFDEFDEIMAKINQLMRTNRKIKKQLAITNGNDGDNDNNDNTDELVIKKLIEHVEKRESLTTNGQQQQQQQPICRRKAVEDIHRRLIQQIKTNDSLENFFNLMNKKKQNTTTTTTTTTTTIISKSKLSDKYSNSLFFNGKDQRLSNKLLCTSVSITNSNNSNNNNNNNSPKTWISSETYGKLPVFDILDELNNENLTPLKSEYPRYKENPINNIITKTTTPTKITTPTKATTPTTTKTTKGTVKRTKSPTTNKSKHLTTNYDEKKGKNNKKPITNKPSYLYNLVNNLEDKNKAWEYLLQPPTLTVCPVKVIYNDNVPTKEEHNNIKNTTIKSLPISPKKKQSIEDQKNIIKKPLAPSSTSPTTTTTTTTTMKKMNINRKLTSIQTTTPKSLTISSTSSILTTATTAKAATTTPQLNYITTTTSSSSSAVTTTTTPNKTEQKMLEKLKGLKEKNDVIQQNIQKAIDVIESKMIDILSKPSESSSSEAFNIMEKEITKVLKMMKNEEKQQQQRCLQQPQQQQQQQQQQPKLKLTNDEIIEKIIPEKDTNPTDLTTNKQQKQQQQQYPNLEECEKLGEEVMKVTEKINEFCKKKPIKQHDDVVVNFLDGLVVDDSACGDNKQQQKQQKTKEDDDILTFLEQLDQFNYEINQPILMEKVQIINIPLIYHIPEVYYLNHLMATSTMNNFIKIEKQEDLTLYQRNIYILQHFYALFFLFTFFILNFDYC